MTAAGHEQVIALDENGVDLLASLRGARDPFLDDFRLEMVATYGLLKMLLRGHERLAQSPLNAFAAVE